MLFKKSILIGVIIVVIAIVCIGILARPKAMGSMQQVYSTSTTNSSDFNFTGEAGEKMKFSFSSDIKKGELNIKLYDSAENMIYELDQARKLETYYTLENNDTYTVVAECKDFVGKFKLKVTRTGEKNE